MAEDKSHYDDLSEEQVSLWQEKLQISISNRQKEQTEKIDDAGGQEAHEKKLENDPVYKKEWEGHEKRIRKEEKAYALAGEWLEEYGQK